jgi:tricorn protease
LTRCDQLRFDLSFPAATRPYLLRLAAATPGPLSPQPAGRGVPWGPLAADADAVAAAGVDSGNGEPYTAEATPETGGVVEVFVEPDGLETRLVELPVVAGRLVELRAVVGGLVWRSLPVAGELGEDRVEPFGEPVKGRLERLDFATGRVETRAEEVDGVQASGDGRTLVVRTDTKLKVQPSDRPQKQDDDTPRSASTSTSNESGSP